MEYSSGCTETIAYEFVALTTSYQKLFSFLPFTGHFELGKTSQVISNLDSILDSTNIIFEIKALTR